MNTQEQLISAKQASVQLRTATTKQKNDFLTKLASLLVENKERIVEENKKDLSEVQGITKAMEKRLKISAEAIEDIAQGLKEVAELADPVGTITKMWKRPNGMQVGRMRAPIGVIFFIFESRPNVIVDAAALCIKSGNVLIARGGKEALNSNNILLQYIKQALESVALPSGAVQQLEDRNYEAVTEVVKSDKYVDLVVPRGREKLIRSIKEAAQVPVIAHERGLCHLYIDKSANKEKAIEIALNAKTSNPSTCNTIETILVHSDMAEEVVSSLVDKLIEAGVEVRGCEKVCALNQKSNLASEEDWDTEYLDMIVSIKVVDSFEKGIEHIQKYSSGLTDTIVTEDYQRSRKFLEMINSAAVLVNVSNRFTDGNQFGLGAELGISTSSVHMKGPMGLEDLTTTKYIVLGDGQIRE